ncbi:Integrase catalytic core [Arabidopsis suecica]|uniref:Integrase catalytic core n=1 Tax=Arabidopsis suecica TaxID=45249 RepID=A0A8T1XGG6_ARASU|nr:Integrase catalytic core [Arabidopsis suecica]
MDHVHHRMSGRSRRPWLGFRPTACGRRALGQKAWGATCVQRLDGSRDSAIHTKYRISLRSSSMREPRYPLPRVVLDFISQHSIRAHTVSGEANASRRYAKPRIRRARDRLRNRPTESGDRWFAGRSVLDRFSGLLATSRAANHPRRRDPNTSPDHSIGRSDGRQIAPPTKNGHAPPPIESRKSSQSVNPYYVWTCNSAGGTTRPIKTRSVSPTEGTSRPVHTKGGPADPSQGRMSFGGTESLRVTVYNFSASEISTGNLFTNANKATNAMSRVRYATQAPDPIIERNIAREVTEKDRWCWRCFPRTDRRFLGPVFISSDFHRPDRCWRCFPRTDRRFLGPVFISSDFHRPDRCWRRFLIAWRCELEHYLTPRFYPPLGGNYNSRRSERRFRRTDLANDTCLWEPKLLLRVGNRAAGACVASSPDSDLEAFSHNPAHGSFAPLAFQPSAMTNSRLALNENPKNPNPKNRRYCSSATLFIAATVHRGYYSSPLLFIAVTIHRRYCSSRLLFIAATIHRRYCSSRLLFIAATVHRGYCSSPLLFIAATVHRRYCSSPLLFIAATVHRRYCSSQLLFITVLFIVDTVHRGTVCGSLQQRELLRSLAPSSLPYNPIRPQRIRKNPKNLTTSKVIDHTAVTVVDGKDVVVATVTHPAVGTTITVDVDPIPAVVEGEDDVVFPNHNTRPNDTIAGIASLIEGHGQAHILLSKGTHLEISDALYSPSSKSLLSFKDIRLNGFHIETNGEGNKEFLNIIEITQGHKKVLETIPALSTGPYYAKIDMIEANMAMNKEFIEKFTLWHDRLGHPGQNMMRKLMTNSKGHTLREKRVIPKNLTCEACSQGKLIIRPSPAKVNKETLNFLERIQGDICGPIHPPCGTFRYFMVLIDASTRWSHVCLLSTRNQAFARLLAQIIRLRAHFPDFPLKTIRLDNAGEFTSQAFNDYCMSMGVSVEHPVAHVHTQNGLAESFIKRIQLIARPLLMRSKLPVAAWGHAVLHSSELIRIRPSSEHRYSPSQLLMGHEPDISHLKTFGCAVYIPIAPPHRTKMGPQRRMGIYVGFDSPTIIKYLEPTTGDLFKARYADCHFNESEFPTLGGETNKLGAIGTEVIKETIPDMEIRPAGFKAHPLSSPMVVRSLRLDSDPFGPKKDEEEVLGPEVPYLSAIGALMNYVWLDPFQGYVGSLLQDAATTTSKTIIFGDNTACIAQLKDGYIKGDRTKHILPKFFFTHDLQRDGEVRVVQVRSSDNSADLFTKALPTSTLRKLTHQIGMRRLKDLQG